MEQKRLKQFDADLALVDGERSFVATITTDAVDRDNEVLLPQGMDSKDFEKNPVVFWNHNYDVPVGQATGLNRGTDRWTAKTVMASRPKDHEGEWFPDTVLSLIKQGVVRGISVGFMPKNNGTRKPTPGDKEMFGEDIGAVHHRWNLLEYSITPLPANQEALIGAVSKRIVTKSQVKELFGIDLPEKKDSPATVRSKATEDKQPGSVRSDDPSEKPKRIKVAIALIGAPPKKKKRIKPRPTLEQIKAMVDKAVMEQVALIDAKKTGKLFLTD